MLENCRSVPCRARMSPIGREFIRAARNLGLAIRVTAAGDCYQPSRPVWTNVESSPERVCRWLKTASRLVASLSLRPASEQRCPFLLSSRFVSVVNPIQKFNEPLTIDPKQGFPVFWIVLGKCGVTAGIGYPNFTVD
jgi:hypothetical protein